PICAAKAYLKQALKWD
ncbi:uvrD/REP helicase N-terminal domain protein, partial [Vibrio parahaemolyticus V-223/04]